MIFLGWINPIPLWYFGRNSVFLAIGSILWNLPCMFENDVFSFWLLHCWDWEKSGNKEVWLFFLNTLSGKLLCLHFDFTSIPVVNTGSL